MMLRTKGAVCRSFAAVVLVGFMLSGCSFHITTGDAKPSTFPTGQATHSVEGDRQVYKGNGVTFSYPTDWHEEVLGAGSAEVGAPEWQASVVLDQTNVIIVREYQLNFAITLDNLDRASSEIDTAVQSMADQADGAVQSGPTSMTVAGFPALGYDVSVKAVSGEDALDSMIFIFDGSTEYFINCQSTSARTGEVATACDEVTGSFQVT